MTKEYDFPDHTRYVMKFLRYFSIGIILAGLSFLSACTLGRSVQRPEEAGPAQTTSTPSPPFYSEATAVPTSAAPTDTPPTVAAPTAAPTSAPTDAPTVTASPAATVTPTPLPGGSEPLDLAGYTPDEIIAYFDEIVMDAEFRNDSDSLMLRKWTTPICYRIEGNPTPEDLDIFNRLMQELNRIPGFPGISQSGPLTANLTIRFLPYEEYAKEAVEHIGDTNTDGYVTGWYLADRYHRAEIGICTDTEQETRNTVILEETIQSLGLYNDSYSYKDSLFYQGFTTPQWPSAMDWLLVKLLYREELQPGMSLEEVNEVLTVLLSAEEDPDVYD